MCSEALVHIAPRHLSSTFQPQRRVVHEQWTSVVLADGESWRSSLRHGVRVTAGRSHRKVRGGGVPELVSLSLSARSSQPLEPAIRRSPRGLGFPPAGGVQGRSRMAVATAPEALCRVMGMRGRRRRASSLAVGGVHPGHGIGLAQAAP